MSLELQWPCHSNGFFQYLRPTKKATMTFAVLDHASVCRSILRKETGGNGWEWYTTKFIQNDKARLTAVHTARHPPGKSQIAAPAIDWTWHWIHSYIETFYPTHDTWRLKSEPVTVHLWQIFLNVIATTNHSELLSFLDLFWIFWPVCSTLRWTVSGEKDFQPLHPWKHPPSYPASNAVATSQKPRDFLAKNPSFSEKSSNSNWRNLN